jgi:glucose/arabinose dehydrogenase
MKLKEVARAAVLVTLAAGCQATPAATPTFTPAGGPTAGLLPPTATLPPAATPHPVVAVQPIADGPVLLRDDISLHKVLDRGGGDIRLVLNPTDKTLYVLNPDKGLFAITLGTPATSRLAASAQDIFTQGRPSGLAFGPDGVAYVVGNDTGKTETHAIIRKGFANSSGGFAWTTLAITAPYPVGNTPFDHLFNGIVISPDGKWALVNSGSRTDHGEVEDNQGAAPNTREVPLTAAIFRIPTNAYNLLLPNDYGQLQAQELVFARGTRNSYDPAFAPNGELFAGDNSPDADYPDELNWLRPGLHFGFPWRFGSEDNPQRLPGYDPSMDHRLSTDFTAVKNGTYRNDPAFPPAPGPFTDPVVNLGPDGAQYRALDGSQQDAAAQGQSLTTFTPHRSPLGLVFTTDPKLPVDLRGDDNTLSAFVLSWGAAGGTLTDRGQDLLHLQLTRQGDNYRAITRQIARGFRNPIDAVMSDNHLYVLEFGDQGAIWELTFK